MLYIIINEEFNELSYKKVNLGHNSFDLFKLELN